MPVLLCQTDRVAKRGGSGGVGIRPSRSGGELSLERRVKAHRDHFVELPHHFGSDKSVRRHVSTEYARSAPGAS